MKSYILSIVCLFVASSIYSQTNYDQKTLEKIKEVENSLTGSLVLNNERPATIAERMEKYHVKGMSIAVIHNYQIAWAKGYGWADESEQRPVTTETLFQAASMHKALNAMGILKLAQENKVDLNTDINTYLTSWKFPYDSVSKGKKITLAHLLSHNAGLSTFGFRAYNIQGEIPSLTDILDGKYPAITSSRIQGGSMITIPAVRSEFEPGVQFQYSGGGTTITQLLLTDVTHEAYDVWMYKNVLKPLGMVNSTYTQVPTADTQHRYASGYYRDGSRVLNKYHMAPYLAAGGLWTTPVEMSHYVMDILLAYKGNPSKVLSPEMVNLHVTPYNNGPTAMGPFVENHDGALYFQHAAGNDGFCGQFYANLDEGYGVVVFLNSEDGKLLYEVINSVAQAYGWKNFYSGPQQKTSISVPDSILDTYEGIYVFENSWAGVGKRDNEYHYYTFGWQNYQYTPMHFSTPTQFFNEEFPSVKDFMKDNEGNTIGFTRTVDAVKYPNAVKVTRPDTLHLESAVFADIGWYLFENKKYSEALAYLKRGLQLYPNDYNLQISTAHAYVYNNDLKNALAIYKAHLNDSIAPNFTWQNLLRNDFIYLAEYHQGANRFDKIFKKLKIKKPKGY